MADGTIPNIPQGDDNTRSDTSNTENGQPSGSGAVVTQENTKTTKSYHHPCQNRPTPKWWHRIDWSQVVLDALLLLVGIKLAYIYKGQLTQMIEQTKIARRGSRPFVGISGIGISYASQDAKGTLHPRPIATPDSIAMAIDVTVKNFGPLPALDFWAARSLFLDGVVMPGIDLHHIKTTLNPTDTIHLTAQFRGPIYQDIRRGKVLTLKVELSYNGPEGSYSECTMYRYQSGMSGFEYQGVCAQ